MRNQLKRLVLASVCSLLLAPVFALKLTSPAFTPGGALPRATSCQGGEESLPLSWSDVPAKTQSFVLLMTDPDAPIKPWTHWVVFNIPANVRQFAAGQSPLPKGSKLGQNSWSRADYGGPCPPKGKHHYVIQLFALDSMLDLEENARKDWVMDAMATHILAKTELIGTYELSADTP